MTERRVCERCAGRPEGCFDDGLCMWEGEPVTTPPKVAIGVPFRRDWEGDSGMAAMALGFYSGPHVKALPVSCKGTYVEENRNGIVQFALDTGIPFDFLLWLDSDNVYPPDALLRLIAHNKDIVGANYRQKMPPYSFVGYYADGRDTHLMEPGLHRMLHLPTGIMLTRFEIYRKIGYPWFQPGLKGEPRDDVFFCNKARAAGYEIWCDHDLTFQCGHVGSQTIGWFQPDQIQQVEGAGLSQARADEEAKERARKVAA